MARSVLSDEGSTSNVGLHTTEQLRDLGAPQLERTQAQHYTVSLMFIEVLYNDGRYIRTAPVRASATDSHY